MTEHDTHDTAGAGSPAPAVSSAAVTAGHDVVPEDARRELDRIRTRWAQLPLARAHEAMTPVRAVLDDLAARTATPGAAVPDLGPAAVPDQLAVLVRDACAAGCDEGIAAALTDLRRALP